MWVCFHYIKPGVKMIYSTYIKHIKEKFIYFNNFFQKVIYFPAGFATFPQTQNYLYLI